MAETAAAGPRVYAVGELVAGLRGLLEERVGRLWLRGEIADLHRRVGRQRDTLSMLGQSVGGLRDPKALQWLLKSVSGSRRCRPPARPWS